MTDQTSNPAAAPGASRATVAFIFVTLVLDVVGFGIIIPVLPKLVESFMAGDTARAAEMYGLMGTAWALMQFLFSPVLGALSDRYGRRSVLLLSCFGLGLDYILMALAPNIMWLFIGRVISGITAASFSTAGAYIADVTPPEKRAAAFGMMGAAFGLGFVLGPALGGVLGGIDPRLPFWVAAVMTLLSAFYGFFVLPESLPRERRAGFSWKRANPVGSLTLLRSHHELFGLAGTLFLMNLAHVVLPSTAVLYMGYRFGWDATTIGLTLAWVGVCAMIVQGGLTKPAVRRFGERRVLIGGLLFGAAGFTIYALAPTGLWFWVGVAVMSLCGLSGPAVQGLMTRHVQPSEQGQLQGANASLMGIAGLVGPGIFTETFAIFIRPGSLWHLPGAPFLLAMLLILAAMLLAWRVTRAAIASGIS